jgi:uncharacterized protein involved in outer membrane biogenesis
VFGMVAGGLFYLTRPATLAALILPRASEAIGGEVTASRVALGGLNSVVLEDLRIRAPRWEGRAGELVYANRMEVRFALLPLLVGEIRLKSVQADRLELRMAEAADQPGNFSFLALEPKPSDDDDTGAPPRPGEISIEELVIENGVVAPVVLDSEAGFEALAACGAASAAELAGQPWRRVIAGLSR